MSGDLTKPSEVLEYYRPQIYWNDFEAVRQRINTKISGAPQIGWDAYLKSRSSRFERCLVLNCGNGWVERDLYRLGLFHEVFGFDISQSLVAEARSHAQEMGMKATYNVADCNTVVPPAGIFDLVVNFAAMHHVAYINRLTHLTAKALATGGKYVAFDYVGPHRNQYPWEVWSAVLELNAALPGPFRQEHIPYPHLKTMLHMDPTEAIHSELQVSVLHRHFDVEEYKRLGGPLAYHILYGNRALYDAADTPAGRSCLQRILDADDEFVTRHPEANLFAFWIATPKPSVSAELIRSWQEEEDRREEKAAKEGGRYYPPTALEILTDEISDLRYKLSSISGQPT